ncbi:DNA mismatch repair protein MutS [Syntrophobotulus glycolicus DSM 8271]|uniref:DNA mismatch repair protein MutS n=1 Tax=Syntrophobotulus glycolicus (strain DSM 8271 / FlGlyR) TaxID=645991 RepID=F0SZI2_SYNGF|nr:DNA mismatch repair protein MutS [Syntrophobotulus glycolicus]ADY56068.1 DNA mismatch repair protein MutS [Syntrophobotulus glycolicus DSM 8271]
MATTPMLKQYESIKAKVPDCILFFRLGDFYEMFADDALTAAPVLEIALTSREGGSGSRIPMCGVPHHSAENYIQKLIAAGFKVAICEQTEDPQQSKGIVKRDIVRIVSPGTVDTVAAEHKNNYLAAIYKEKDWGLAYLDLTTGDFRLFQTPSQQTLLNELNRINPAEIILPKEFAVSMSKALDGYYSNAADKTIFSSLAGFRERFHNYTGLLEQMPVSARAAGALWNYIKKNIPDSSLQNVIELKSCRQSEVMVLDRWTRKNLELVESSRFGDERGTIFDVLNLTKTAFGARMLRHWIQQPLLNKEQIEARLDTVEELTKNTFARQELFKCLSHVYDLERLTARLSYGKASPRDMLALAATLACLPEVRKIIHQHQVLTLTKYLEPISGLDDLSAKLLKAINPDAPVTLHEGNIINNGYIPEIDRLRAVASGGRDWIARLENQEREKTKIKSLKIGYNKVFGYYIEITNANSHLVPEDYIRKQTLANCERYITPELKEYEQQVLNAQEKLFDLEYAVYTELKDEVLSHTPPILNAAQAIGEIDVFLSLAEAAVRHHYVRPEINNEGTIHIVEGRHPVVEQVCNDLFVPNDTLLTSSKSLALITGPNMGGKSTYMRQVALIVLLSQVGSFVPAQKAAIALRDCIYTRVGASDNLASGQSTFMVEMNEVAFILQNAASRSLIILDEVGRGTATYDGLSLAWAIVEYLAGNPTAQPLTLFATHYHELTALETMFPAVFNLHVAVREKGSDILFLHKILPGKADRSYGLHVAKIAGLPLDLLKRAESILRELESLSGETYPDKATRVEVLQPSLFDQEEVHPLLKEVEEIDLDRMTPKQAMDYLYDLVSRIRSSKVL